MIKFFRNIRKKLAAENKVTPYLRYAIGEIVLVVIGILIALSINNWNENRKNNSWEKKFLTDLKNELEKNKEQLQNIDFIQTKKGDDLIETITLVKNADPLNKSKIDSLFAMTQVSNPTFFPTTGVYDSGLAAGKIENVKNDALKYAIMNLYNHYYKRLVYNGEILDEVVGKVDWEELKFYDNFSKTIKGWNSVIDPDFLAQLDYQLFRNSIYTRLTKQNLEVIDNVIDSISKELNK